jgi:hypothetical protein
MSLLLTTKNTKNTKASDAYSFRVFGVFRGASRPCSAQLGLEVGVGVLADAFVEPPPWRGLMSSPGTATTTRPGYSANLSVSSVYSVG